MGEKTITGSKPRILLWALIFNIVLTIGLSLLNAFFPDEQLSMGGRLAISTANIVAVIATLQFGLALHFESINKSQLVNKEELKLQVKSLEKLLRIEEIHRKILTADEHLRPYVESMLQTSIKSIAKCVDDKRTGALSIEEYYPALHNLADELLSHNANTGHSLKGFIWAQTSFLDIEWDMNTMYEKRWGEKLSILDKNGIITKRLCIFTHDLINTLKQSEFSERMGLLVSTIKAYFAETSEFQNTTTLAIRETDLDNTIYKKTLGPGFFGAWFDDERLRLIRDVSLDEVTSKTLLGEVDCDEDRVKNAYRYWSIYCSNATPIIEFVRNHSNDFFKTELVKVGVVL